MTSLSEILRRRQTEELFSSLSSLKNVRVPKEGWIKEVRKVLKMSGTQLAHRMGIEAPTLFEIEKSEEKKTISIKTLQRAAEQLGCELFYILLPKTSIEEILRERAMFIAKKQIERVAHSMALEDQAIEKKELQNQIENFALELLKSIDSKFWSEQS